MFSAADDIVRITQREVGGNNVSVGVEAINIQRGVVDVRACLIEGTVCRVDAVFIELDAVAAIAVCQSGHICFLRVVKAVSGKTKFRELFYVLMILRPPRSTR